MNKMVTKAAPLETFQVVADRLFVTGEPGTAVGNKNARIARRLIWFCRMANLPPETTPASVGTMMKFFDANRPATFNLSPGTYAVYRSEMLSVLKPEPVQKGRYILQMQGVYREVHDLTVKSDLPEQFRWRCAPLLWYLHDNSILPRDIADDTLIKYYQFNLEVVRVPEDQARRRAQDGAKYISKMAQWPEFETFGFAPVQIKFRNRSIKYDVPFDIADNLLKEFDDRVVPWAKGEASNKGESWSDYIERLDAIEPDLPVSEKKKKWKASQEYKGRVAVGQQVSKGSANGFLPESRRWKAVTIENRRNLCSICVKVLFESEDVKLETIEELTDPEFLEAIATRLRARKIERRHM